MQVKGAKLCQQQGVPVPDIAILGINVVVGDGWHVGYYSNRSEAGPEELLPGVCVCARVRCSLFGWWRTAVEACVVSPCFFSLYT
jgi:hypothetical protein